MASNSDIRLVDLDEDGVDRAFRADVLAGLSQRQKAVPARWFYDAEGSRLFEEITKLPEYYPTRAETQILSHNQAQLAELIGPHRAVVEFGSGSSVKTPLLLEAIEPAAYVPLDISGDFLRASAAELGAKFPALSVHPVEADFTKPVTLPDDISGTPKLGFFPGSTIGNMVARTAVDLLRNMRQTLGDGSQLLIGMDLVKNRQILLDAYNDAAGVTAQFNLNLIHRINRELAANIPAENLQHKAVWNDVFARIEMHLEAQTSFAFDVAGQSFLMRKGETIHTENSHKFKRRSSYMLLLAGGWTPVQRWLDPKRRFSLILAQASEPRSAP